MVEKSKKGLFHVFAEYFPAIIGAVFLAILIRGFVFEPFKIPSESMVPTLLVGDHIFVLRYQYGLRVPFTKYWLAEFDDPQRGDVVVFTYPKDEDVDYIKRIVAVPGDKVKIQDGFVFVNGQKLENVDLIVERRNKAQKKLLDLTEESQKILPQNIGNVFYFPHFRDFQIKLEKNTDNKQYLIQQAKSYQTDRESEFEVPARSFFVLGDNRDRSQDSRFWGFVPRENLKGKAVRIWLSLDESNNVRWNRFGKPII